MRTQRLGLIQTPDQLRFSYIAILHGADNVLKGDDDNSLSDEGVASEDSAEENEGEMASEKKEVSEDQSPPPLPPRHSDTRRPHIEGDDIKKDEESKPPKVLTRTASLSGSSSQSVTPEPPPLPARDFTPPPPPLPPRDKTMYNDERFLGEREGNPSVNDIPSQNAENLTAMEHTLNR